MASQTTCAVSIQDRSKGERQPIVCPRPGPPMVRAMAGWRPPITRVVCRSDGRTPANRIVIGLPGLSRQPTTAGYVLDPSSRPADLLCIALNGRDGTGWPTRCGRGRFGMFVTALLGGGGGDGDGEVVRGRQRRRAAQRRQARRLVYSRVPVAAAWARHHRIASRRPRDCWAWAPAGSVCALHAHGRI